MQTWEWGSVCPVAHRAHNRSHPQSTRNAAAEPEHWEGDVSTMRRCRTGEAGSRLAGRCLFICRWQFVALLLHSSESVFALCVCLPWRHNEYMEQAPTVFKSCGFPVACPAADFTSPVFFGGRRVRFWNNEKLFFCFTKFCRILHKFA